MAVTQGSSQRPDVGEGHTTAHAATCSDRILSIQSHVAFGYVGGKAAVFPLQCMGYDVDVVNTVNFSNHTGYGYFGGTKTTAEELSTIFDSMDKTGVLTATRLLTGYVPNAASLDVVHRLARKLKARNPDLIYLLDTVLGDAGKLYVTADVIPAYRKILPLATVIAPNWFEVETLTDMKLTDLASLRGALGKLHVEYRVPNVVISSIPLSRIAASIPEYLLPSRPTNGVTQDGASTPPDEQQYLICIVSSVNDVHSEASSSISIVHARCVPLIPGYFSGVGDLFSALLLGHFHPLPTPSAHGPACTSPVASATAHALAKTHAILSLTHLAASTESLPATDDELDAHEPERMSRRMKGRELKLVQGQDIFKSEDLVEPMIVWEGFWKE
ncbi:bud site selection protein 16 [Pisolithus croceorrhizus]|nr:bud site selection protein 16 [Pisolithus croceorrhizus]KAI6130243.1 bud site selection protein 16 [Pisolithus croceorrhizus]KAI6164481.1 bud site selection protein 16 [Pisolithus thermaeus]